MKILFLLVTCSSFFLSSLTTALAPEISRRRAIATSAGIASAIPFLSDRVSGNARAADDDVVAGGGLVVPSGLPVLVLGASGGTGRECVTATLLSGRPCIATTRTGEFAYEGPDNGGRLSTCAADVTSAESLSKAFGRQKVGAVIFAASASTKRDRDPFKVDRDGVIEAARLCIEQQIPRFVLVSSGSVTRPDSAVYKLLNTVGKGIMEAKIQGEDAVRELYSDPRVIRRNLGYTIVRPGGLTTGEVLGPGALELNQGDMKSGRLARADVAGLCVKALDSADTFDTTFECYESSTGKTIEAVGFSNILKSNNPTNFLTGKERQGETYASIFRGLERDAGHSV